MRMVAHFFVGKKATDGGTMIENYKEAKKLGDDAVKKAEKEGLDPYLPVLDAVEGGSGFRGEESLGLQELPIEMITGNKEKSRNNAFANNFMPLLEADTEFAFKWIQLHDSVIRDGMRDAIKVYEYKNRYYVQEGNKRVSVATYIGSEFILADVTRLLPVKEDTAESRVYEEFLEFYHVTGNYLIVLTEQGGYHKIAELMGWDMKVAWPEEDRKELKSAYYRFRKSFRIVMKKTDPFVTGNAFLMYISIFPPKTLLEDTQDQITNNIRTARAQLSAGRDMSAISFLEQAPTGEAKGGFLHFFAGGKKYTGAKPLHIGFIYDSDIETSRWIDLHEAGRLYVDAMTGDNVVTGYYEVGTGDDALTSTLDSALADGNEILFTVSPGMLDGAVRAAVTHPQVKILNCSIGKPNPAVRSYQGRLYEATFLMGVYAADIALRIGAGDTIGYIVREDATSTMNINAFAIGVSLIHPDCRIQAAKITGEDVAEIEKNEKELLDTWRAEGVNCIADFDYPAVKTSGRPGLFRIDGDKPVYLGAPYYNWGRYYVQIVQSVLSGAWDITQSSQEHDVTNYWFGLATGVVDIRIPKLEPSVAKLLAFLKKGIVSGDAMVFEEDGSISSGEIINMRRYHDSIDLI